MNIENLPAVTGTRNMQTLAINGALRAQQAYTAEAEKISRGDFSVNSVVEANQQSTLYSINLKLFSTADKMTGSVLNLIA
jgi:hypothetical protein